MTTGFNLKDLETKGFVAVPGFLSTAELGECQADFRSQPNDRRNLNYSGITDASRATAHLLPRIREMLRLVSEQTDLQVDSPAGAAFFSVGRGINFAWHQDHESFFSLQNHYDYLNFYIPIVKPRRDKSNLCIIPFDVLEAESPRTFQRVVRRGASRFIRAGKKRLVFCDDNGSVHVMSTDIERLAHTPMLAAGDLLLLRGDIIHRTQDAETERVALSFRASNSRAVIKRRRLADGGLHKARMMAKNPRDYQKMFLAFDAAQKDEMTLRELSAVMSTIDVVKPKAGTRFLAYLLAEKRKAHVLARFFPKLVIGVAAGQCISLYERYTARE
jgi:hypothetical protein